MQRTAAAKNVLVNASSPAAANCTSPSLTECQAAEIMWVYYRDNKAQFITDIKDYRDSILAQLMAGQAAEQVFAPFARPAEPVRRVRRAT